MFETDHLTGSTTLVVVEGRVKDHAVDLSPDLQVLVVEDSPIVRERLIRLLSVVPNLRIVSEAATADEAIRKITDLCPDVVTLDLRLGKGSGLDVLRALAGFEQRPRV